MKKILIATTALVLTAGVAAAEVTLSGTARMGVVSNTDFDDKTQFSSRIRIIFTASGETDGGLSFGASVRNDQSGVGNKSNGDSTVFISGAFGKITMGDVGGAADALVGQVDGVGYTGLGDYNEIGFVGTDKTAAYYEYSAGSFTFGLGLGQIDKEDGGSENQMSVAAKFTSSNDAFTIAAGYESFDDGIDGPNESLVSVSGSANFGAATVKAKIADSSISDDTAFALSVTGTFGAVGVTAFYADFGSDVKNIGLGGTYDLGGGASVAGGVVSVDDGVATETIADLGLKFRF